MRICMITTFFGAYSFGGDAAYVDRLARALLRRGHGVEVIHSADAFQAVRRNHPLRVYAPPPALRIHTLRSRLGTFQPLWTHQTGRPGPALGPIRDILAAGSFDVVHFHNVSLLGGPALLSLPFDGVKLLSAHDHWLVCPLSLLWKYDRRVCDKPECARCTVRAGRPAQLWRRTPLLHHALSDLDALLVPSLHTREEHHRRGIRVPITCLSYFLPDDDFLDAPPPVSKSTPDRPYFLIASRLIKEKGVHDVIAQMAAFPEIDLWIAGTGPFEPELRRMAAGQPNVRFLGLLDYARLRTAYRGARSLIVPSLFHETFGYVVLEAFATGTPAIVRRRGALPELIEASGGGLHYETADELRFALRRLALDPAEADRMGKRAHTYARTRWSEQTHVDRYLALIDAARAPGRVRIAREQAGA